MSATVYYIVRVYVLFSVILASMLLSSTIASVDAAQLTIRLHPDADSAPFKIKYQKTVYIEYNDGGQVADALRGTSWNIVAASALHDPDSIALTQAVNQKIVSDGSQAQVSNLQVNYTASLKGNPLNAAIDYTVLIHGDLVGYVIRSGDGQNPTLVDMGWRGLSAEGQFMIGDVEINHPLSAIESQNPELASLIAGSEAEELLKQNIINGDFIGEQPLTSWHYLFDPTGVNVDAAQFGLSDELSGFVVSAFTMGESSIREGRQVEREVSTHFVSDKTYGVTAIQSPDIANVDLIGFAQIDQLDGVEIVGVYPQAPAGYANPGGGGFPVAIVYGMAGVAAAGGVGFFAYSSRQVKKEQGQGQTGIDPSRLVGYATSASSGGYQTNRGEAQLADESSYQQTRSVYENQAPPSPSSTSPPSTPGSTLTSVESTCGCVASADLGEQCDCDMQSSCLCDATCSCTSPLCKEHSNAF